MILYLSFHLVRACVYLCVVRLCKSRGADHRASPFCCGGDVRDPPRFEPHQRPPEAAALRLHCQRWSSPGLRHVITDCSQIQHVFSLVLFVKTVTHTLTAAHLRKAEYLVHILYITCVKYNILFVTHSWFPSCFIYQFFALLLWH